MMLRRGVEQAGIKMEYSLVDSVDLEMPEGSQIGLSSKHSRHETLDLLLDLLKPPFPQVGNVDSIKPLFPSGLL